MQIKYKKTLMLLPQNNNVLELQVTPY